MVTFRLYSEGIAYHISTFFKDRIYIKNEVARFAFVNNPSVYFPLIHKKSNADIYHTSFEKLYPLLVMSTITAAIAFSPVLVMPKTNTRIAITESDLCDYPGMFLRGTGEDAFDGTFTTYPLEEKEAHEFYSQSLVIKRAEYIAHTVGRHPVNTILKSYQSRVVCTLSVHCLYTVCTIIVQSVYRHDIISIQTTRLW